MASDTEIREALRQVVDPELGVNIVDLGLVYRTEVEGSHVRVVMTMTSRACPLGDYIKDLARSTITKRFPDLSSIDVALVWEPPWDPGMMSDDARRQLDGPR